MSFELPTPRMIFDVTLEDGAKICVRRHGRADGVRLFFSHGNGFAADAYFPYWRHLLTNFDLLLFDFRNHGHNVPVVPPHHTYEQLTRDLERVIQAVKVRLGERPTAGLFHSMSARTAMKHAIEIGSRWDALVLFDPPTYRRPIIRFILRWRPSKNAWSIGRFTGVAASGQLMNSHRNISSRGQPPDGLRASTI